MSENILKITEDLSTSLETQELDKALAKVKEEMSALVEEDGTNPHFRNSFTSLSALLKAATPVLAKHGLSLQQHPTSSKLVSRLSHSSGQWIVSEYSLPTHKDDPQGDGSAITYARRYCYQSILGLAGDMDDDGNASMPISAGPPMPRTGVKR